MANAHNLQSLTDLNDYLNNDLFWRKHELTTARLTIDTFDDEEDSRKRTFLRAYLCLLYAHWEGFVKTASQAYIRYVSTQSIQLGDLSPNLIALALGQQIRDAGRSNKLEWHAALTELLRGPLDQPFDVEADKTFLLNGNLNIEMLKEILLALGADSTSYETRKPIIDYRLLSNRNAAAHGERLTIGWGDYVGLHDMVIQLVDRFKEDVEESAEQKKYLIPAKGDV